MSQCPSSLHTARHAHAHLYVHLHFYTYALTQDDRLSQRRWWDRGKGALPKPLIDARGAYGGNLRNGTSKSISRDRRPWFTLERVPASAVPHVDPVRSMQRRTRRYSVKAWGSGMQQLRFVVQKWDSPDITNPHTPGEPS
jgi:hypothetical protein